MRLQIWYLMGGQTKNLSPPLVIKGGQKYICPPIDKFTKASVTFLILILKTPFKNHCVDQKIDQKMVLERYSDDNCQENYGWM